MGMHRGALAAIAVGLAFAASPTPAPAHPHVWIEARSDAVFNESGEIAAVNVEWRFDEFYSATAVEGLDKDGNGTYEPEELQPLALENLTALKDFRFFVDVTADDQPVDYGAITEYGSFFKDGVLSLYFTIPLAKPVDPKTSTLVYSMYDPSYYIAVDLAVKNPVELLGSPPDGCKAEIRPSEADSTTAETAESFYEKLDASSGMGALYAQRVAVVCTRKTAAQ